MARPEHGERLRERGIVYAPDYVINAGGIIKISAELSLQSANHADDGVARIYETTRGILQQAAALTLPPEQVADARARAIILGAAVDSARYQMA